MPRVRFEGQDILCPAGANLRTVLKGAGLSPHSTPAWLNCRGIGSCGTCTVEIDGATSARTSRERWRLLMPPHDGNARLRLACQVTVEGDLEVTRHGGFWGQLICEEQPS
jgi:ferredoxin